MNRAREWDDWPDGLGWLVVVAVLVGGCEAGSRVDGSGPIAVDANQVRILGTSDDIASVLDLEVLTDGSVWVLNSVEPYFLGFAPDGNILGWHGTAGRGPHEFRMPAGFLAGGFHQEAWVFDYVRHAFIRISGSEQAWAQIDLPPDDLPPGSVRGGMSLISQVVRTARLGEELIVPSSSATLQDGLPAYHSSLMLADLVAVDPEAGTARRLVSLGDVLDDPAVGFVATDGGFPLWHRLWAVCGDHIRVHDRVRNQLRGFTVSGPEMEPIDLPTVALTEVTPEEFARAVFLLRQAEVTGGVGTGLTEEDSLRVIRQVAQELTGQPNELAAYLPRYVDFRCSDEGVMWLQPIDLDAGGMQGSRSWLRIGADGARRTVRFPRGFDPFRFTVDRVWGVQRDELDVGSIAWIDLTEESGLADR